LRARHAGVASENARQAAVVSGRPQTHIFEMTSQTKQRSKATTKDSAAGDTALERAQGPGARSAYDQFKEFGGKKYTGMKVGRGHKWQYAAGEWVEKKVTPDKWEFHYAVGKKRAGHAPEGSGVPVGTEYHWYILADQTVTKLDANNYSTDMVGVKYKLAHKRADKASWNGSDRAQRKHLIAILEATAAELRAGLDEHASAERTPADAGSTNDKAGKEGTVGANAVPRKTSKVPSVRARGARHPATAGQVGSTKQNGRGKRAVGRPRAAA
jgi:hypothetical protein